MEVLPLTCTVTQATAGEIYEIEFRATNTIFKWILRQLKIDGVVATPHAIQIQFEGLGTDDIECFDLNRPNKYISLGRQVGTVWIDKSDIGYSIKHYHETKPFRTLRFRVLNNDDGSDLVFTRLSIKLDGYSDGGLVGSVSATKQTTDYRVSGVL